MYLLLSEDKFKEVANSFGSLAKISSLLLWLVTWVWWQEVCNTFSCLNLRERPTSRTPLWTFIVALKVAIFQWLSNPFFILHSPSLPQKSTQLFRCLFTFETQKYQTFRKLLLVYLALLWTIRPKSIHNDTKVLLFCKQSREKSLKLEFEKCSLWNIISESKLRKTINPVSYQNQN